MTENERLANLFILFLLMMMKTGVELYLNHVPLIYLFSYPVFIIPFLLTVLLGIIGEVIIWIKENKTEEEAE